MISIEAIVLIVALLVTIFKQTQWGKENKEALDFLLDVMKAKGIDPDHIKHNCPKKVKTTITKRLKEKKID